MTVETPLVLLAGALGIMASGFLAHELTHLAIIKIHPSARLLSFGPGNGGLVAGFEIDDDASKRVEEFVAIAPLLFGIVGGALSVFVLGWPDPSPWSLAIVGGWAIYSFPMDVDLTIHGGDPDELPHFQIIRACYIALVGMAISSIWWGMPLQLIGDGIQLGAIGLLGIWLIGHERRGDARAGA